MCNEIHTNRNTALYRFGAFRFSPFTLQLSVLHSAARLGIVLFVYFLFRVLCCNLRYQYDLLRPVGCRDHRRHIPHAARMCHLTASRTRPSLTFTTAGGTFTSEKTRTHGSTHTYTYTSLHTSHCPSAHHCSARARPKPSHDCRDAHKHSCTRKRQSIAKITCWLRQALRSHRSVHHPRPLDATKG